MSPLKLTTHWPLGVAGAIALLALVETGNSLLAPHRVVSDEEWRAAAAFVPLLSRHGQSIDSPAKS